jgi:hypothetical protein
MDVQCLHAQHYPGIFQMPQRDVFAVSFFEEMLIDPMVSIFIAEEDGNAVGYILCKLIERPETPFTIAARILFAPSSDLCSPRSLLTRSWRGIH